MFDVYTKKYIDENVYKKQELGSIVTKNCDSDSVYAGNPAKKRNWRRIYPPNCSTDRCWKAMTWDLCVARKAGS